MRTRVFVTGVVAVGILVALAAPARAQSGGGRTAAWTAVGAGAGFGVGLWAGLTAFDDAIDSDRKVWTSAIIGAAVGGTLVFLASRSRRGGTSPSARNAGIGAPTRNRVAVPPMLGERELAQLASSALPRGVRPPAR